MGKNKLKIGLIAFAAISFGALSAVNVSNIQTAKETYAIDSIPQVGTKFKYSSLYFEITSTEKNEVKVIYDPSYASRSEIVFMQSSLTATYSGQEYTITEIGDGAFKDCTNLTYIWMLVPDFIIADNAFENINKNAAVILNDNSYYDYYKDLTAFNDIDFYLLTDKKIKNILPSNAPTTYTDGFTNVDNKDLKLYFNSNLNCFMFGQSNKQNDTNFYISSNIHYNENTYLLYETAGSFFGYVKINFENGEIYNIIVNGFNGNKEIYNGVYGKPIRTLGSLISYDIENMPTSKDNGWYSSAKGPKLYFKDSIMYVDDTPIASYDTEIDHLYNYDFESITEYYFKTNNYDITVETCNLSVISIWIASPTGELSWDMIGQFYRPSISNLEYYFTNANYSDLNKFVNENGYYFNDVLTHNYFGQYNECTDEPFVYKNGKYIYLKDEVKMEFSAIDGFLSKITVSGLTGDKAEYNGEYKAFTRVAKPVKDDTEFTYNGNPQTYFVEENENYTITGQTKTDAGSSTVKVSLKENKLWEDGTNYDVTFSFYIEKAEGKIELDTNDIVVSSGEKVTIPTATSNFGTVTSDLTGELTEVGEYIVTYTLKGNSNYSGDKKTLKIIINEKAISDVVDKKGEKLENSPVQIVGSEKGFEANTKFVVDELDVNKEKDINKAKTILKSLDKLSDDEKICAIYDITLVKDGVEIQPNGKIKLKMKLPTELEGKDFKLYNIHTNEDGSADAIIINTYDIDNGFLTFETNKFSQFAFVTNVNNKSNSNSNSNSWIIWVCIGSVVLIGAAVSLVVVLKKKKAQ